MLDRTVSGDSSCARPLASFTSVFPPAAVTAAAYACADAESSARPLAVQDQHGAARRLLL